MKKDYQMGDPVIVALHSLATHSFGRNYNWASETELDCSKCKKSYPIGGNWISRADNICPLCNAVGALKAEGYGIGSLRLGAF